jgi:hypothetical protein
LSAALNFQVGIDIALKGRLNPTASDAYFKRILAHRKYQLAISMYKALKYGSKYSKSSQSDEENLLISRD